LNSKSKHIKNCSDEELMVHIQNHQSHPALTELHQRYSKKLLGFFYKMLHKDEEKARDFVQDIFLKILEKNHLFDPERKFYTWIFTIANNMCKTAYRQPFQESISQNESSSHKNALDSSMQLSDNLAEKELFRELLETSIRSLDEHLKTTFVLRYLEHFSLQEIAEITATPLGTVKSRLFYATQKMATQLREYNPKHESNLFKLI